MLIYKNSLKKIRKSIGRYLSIFLIVFIGVGFFSGIRSTSPDIRTTADEYYKEYNLMDFKIVSSLGLTDDDVNAVSDIDNVEKAVGSYSADVLDGDKTIRVHAIENSLNEVELISGRLPETETECVADRENYNIGDKIKLEGDTESLKNTEYTVTGLVDSVLYLTYDYGTTTVGDGKLSSYIFIDKSNFDMDIYTVIYVTMNDSKLNSAYTDSYNASSEKLNEQLAELKPERENAREEEIYKEASDKIAENEQKLISEKKKGEIELGDAKAELDNNRKKIEDAKKELEANEKELNSSINKQYKEFEKSKNEISDARNQINETLDKNGLTEKNLPDAVDALKTSIDELNAHLTALTPGTTEYNMIKTQIDTLNEQYSGLVILQTSIEKINKEETRLKDGIKTFNQKITESREKLESGKAEILSNEQKINEAYEEYNDSLEEFNSEMKKAEEKIADAKEELKDLELSKWTIFDRDAAIGYSSLETDTEVVINLAVVFPIFFIIIVVLMTSNTMTRMIDEERSEIGTFTSLGYSNNKIIKPYLLYVLSASGLGAIIGYFVGGYILPTLIFKNFVYNLPDLLILFDPIMFIFTMVVTLGIMSAITIWSCLRKLRHEPAKLLRPKPPRKGHTILLQHVGIIWNHLSFTWKVTMRNMFRFKKRALMTIIGVAGCAALMLMGFGLRDSMDGIVDKQYGEIFSYDNMITLKNEINGRNDNSFSEIDTFLKDGGVESTLLLNQTAVTLKNDDLSADIYVIVPESVDESFDNFFHLKDVNTNAVLSIEAEGAVISQKIADAFNIEAGDTIEVSDIDSNTYEIKIIDVTENYISNYIYMDGSMYEDTFEKDLRYNTIVSSYDGNDEDLATKLMDNDEIVNITFVSDIVQDALDANAQLDSIVILIIIIACMLAFIVLYNLTAINISERTREIATLKVLGFREYETNTYIYRESIVLALLSIIIGLICGVFIHSYVVDVIEGTSRILSRTIHIRSFIFSGMLTLIFSLIMQIFTYFKLKTVNMIESLKSVE